MSDIDLKKQIELIYAKLDNLLNKLTKPQKSEYSFYQWLTIWCDTYKKPFIKPKSLLSIQQCIRVHIMPYFEDCNLADLSALKIQEALNKITSSRMRKYTYDVYNGSIVQAIKLELISKNPMLNVLPVRHNRKVGRALTIIEQKEFLSAIKGNRLENLYKFYLLTGCRMSEALTITREDVDYNSNTIHINGTKTESSNRYIPIFKSLKNLLLKINTDNFLFPYNANIVICNFKRIKKKHNFKFTIHSLRHTFATRCIEYGISLKTVQKWLGHSKLDTTANIYTHIQTEFEKKESEKFNLNI